MKAIFAVPATLALVYRAWSHNSLTPAGIVVAAMTAIAHAVHPWSLPFVLLVVFFLAGTGVTKIKKEVKEKLTITSTGSSGGEGPRTHIQVLANSGVASVLTLFSAYQLSSNPDSDKAFNCYPWGGDLLIVGIIANYAAVAADTFSSELGILSSSQPRLITSPTLRKVPKGTNGGVTLWGLLAGLLGSFIIVTTAMTFLPFCGSRPLQIFGRGNAPFENKLGSGNTWGLQQTVKFALGLTIWGALGSVLDSLLGGWLQQSVVDIRSGRVVEGEGGKKVLVSKPNQEPNTMHFKKRAELKAKMLNREGKKAIPKHVDSNKKASDREVEDELDAKMGYSKRQRQSSSSGDGEPSRMVESGLRLLDNNEVNFLMALAMSLGAMVVAAWAWDVPFSSILPKY